MPSYRSYIAPRPRPAIDRFLTKVREGPVPPHRPDLGPCLLWTGARDTTTDYGSFWDGTKVVRPHRWAFEHYVGPIPDGFHVDHLCRVHSCVRWSHLEAITLMENLLRGDRSHLGRYLRERTHCPRNHPYDESNTWYSKDGRRHCRACNRERMQERRAQR